MASKKLRDAQDSLNKLERKQRQRKSTIERKQDELEKAAAKHLPTAEKLRKQLARLRHWVKVRDKTIDEQRKVVAKLKKAGSKHQPGVAKRIISPCRSSRGGVKPRLIVLHLTVSHNLRGLGDVEAVANYFARYSTQASSNIIVDAEGHTVRCVEDADKAWAQAAYNPQALSIEQVGYTDLASPEAWHKEYQKGLEKVAHWCAWWSYKYDIPLVHSTTRGVCQHRNLGAAGGGHVDVGANYPEAWVIARAREIKKAWGV